MRAVLLLTTLISMNLQIMLDVHQYLNDKFIPLLSNKARHLHLYGSAGSSKSHFCARKLNLRVMAGMMPGHLVKHRLYCLCKTEPEVRRSVFTLLADLRNNTGQLDRVMEPQGSMLAFRYANGSTIQCMGLDNQTKLKSIERPTGFWLEEATRFTRADRTQVNLRMRGDLGTYKQTLYSYNPDTVACSLYKDHHQQLGDLYSGWGTGRDNNRFFHHSTYLDNRWIDDEYKEELDRIKEIDADYWRVYSQGLWGARRHLIYGGYYRVCDDHEWPANPEERVYGLDFGYNNPSALMEVLYYDGVPYTREVIYERRLTNDQLIERFEEKGVDRNDPIYADSAEPARIEAICNAGYNCIGATDAKKPNAVRARIDLVKAAHQVVHPDSANYHDELRTYKWKLNKDEEPLDKPVKYMDHACNAVEYAIFQHAVEAGVAPGLAVVPV